jgi:hypothetical protein
MPDKGVGSKPPSDTQLSRTSALHLPLPRSVGTRAGARRL